jgi:hypothetical protein
MGIYDGFETESLGSLTGFVIVGCAEKCSVII